MKRVNIIIIIVLLISLGILVYISQEFMSDKECEKDDDCMAASCCHATECTSVTNAPNCSGVFCSAVCSGHLDCGVGYCGCVNKKCEVIKNE
jgi:hypothetical protein